MVKNTIKPNNHNTYKHETHKNTMVYPLKMSLVKSFDKWHIWNINEHLKHILPANRHKNTE